MSSKPIRRQQGVAWRAGGGIHSNAPQIQPGRPLQLSPALGVKGRTCYLAGVGLGVGEGAAVGAGVALLDLDAGAAAGERRSTRRNPLRPRAPRSRTANTITRESTAIFVLDGTTLVALLRSMVISPSSRVRRVMLTPGWYEITQPVWTLVASGFFV